jgi:hypothetical protein
MPPDLSLSEQFAFSTVRVEVTRKDGGIATGTAFFFRFLDEGVAHVPALVTNKHVVADCESVRFRFHLRDADGSPVIGKHMDFQVDNAEAACLPHPDPAVDLCLFATYPILKQLDDNGIRLFYKTFSAALIPTAEELRELGALEEVVMVGYPAGLWDETNNMPLFRRGITATHPGLAFNGRAEFMIDSACFPGSSGSPVILYNPQGWTDKKGNIVLGSRHKLLGVLYAGPQMSMEGDIVIASVPTQQMPRAMTRVPINLGVVIRSQELLSFESVLKAKRGA